VQAVPLFYCREMLKLNFFCANVWTDVQNDVHLRHQTNGKTKSHDY